MFTDAELVSLDMHRHAQPHRRLFVPWERALSHASRLIGRSLTYGNACQLLGHYICDTMPDDQQLQLWIVTHRFDQ